jgi:hypothetical protein
MTVSKKAVLGLLLFAYWTIFVWVTRVWNIVNDDKRSTGFKLVHSVLAGISIVFAVWTIRLVRRNVHRA